MIDQRIGVGLMALCVVGILSLLVMICLELLDVYLRNLPPYDPEDERRRAKLETATRCTRCGRRADDMDNSDYYYSSCPECLTRWMSSRGG